MAFTSQQPVQFYPKSDASFLSPSSQLRPLLSRPEHVGPIFDLENADKPIEPWTEEADALFPPQTDQYAPASIPDQPTCPSPRYVGPHLAKNERLRLSMLWYYTQDLDKEAEFLAGLQEKANLAQESTGWEYAVIGIVDVHVYLRLATVGLDLSTVPRRETLCAHTVNQPPGVCQPPSELP